MSCTDAVNASLPCSAECMPHVMHLSQQRSTAAEVTVNCLETNVTNLQRSQQQRSGARHVLHLPLTWLRLCNGFDYILAL